jgi:hypothetical protein
MKLKHPSLVTVWGTCCATVVSLALVASSPTVFAQETSSTLQLRANSDADSDDLYVLEQMEEESLIIEALKSESSIQEAPSIVTVLQARDLEQMGYRSIADAIQAVPSFLVFPAYYHGGQSYFNRGIPQGALVLHNTVDSFDITSTGNLAIGTEPPIESVKHIELMSGPAGVLWGVNSFAGLINIVTKTGDDLQGIEASAGYGDGPGRPGRFRAYLMGGQKLYNDRIKVFAHISYETWHHPELRWPVSSILRSTAPNPQGPMVFAGSTVNDSPRSHAVVFDGNVQMGPLQLYWHVPWQWFFMQASLGGNVAHHHLDEDEIDCTDPMNKDACLNRVDPLRISRFTHVNVWQDYAMLRYRTGLLQNKLKLDLRSSYIYFSRTYPRYTSIPPSTLITDGVSAQLPFDGHRASFIADVVAKLPQKSLAVFGGEIFYDYGEPTVMSINSRQPTLQRLPFYPACPELTGDYIGGTEHLSCPIVNVYQSDRLNTGLYLNLKTSIIPRVSLEAGGRLQAAPAGNQRHDPVPLFSGAAVWSFLPNWHLKTNYAEGLRPSAFARTNANPDGLTWGHNPDLKAERSRALQGEINAVLLRGYKTIKKVELRSDYSYTWASDLVQTSAGRNENLSDMGIHSVELMASMRMRRGHWFTMAYTFLDMSDTARGKVRAVPNQWATLQALLNLWNRQLFLSSNLTIVGSVELPTRHLAESAGTVMLGKTDENGVPMGEPVWRADANDMALARISPFPLWNAGLRFLWPAHRVRINLDAYNILNGRGYHPEGEFDLSAFLKAVPNPREGFSFFCKLDLEY